MNNLTYFVSPFGNDSWSGMLAESNEDKTDGPLQTLYKVKEKIKQKLKKGLNSDIIVMLRGGNYYLDNTIKFTEEDSPVNGYKVIYKNYPGEEPIINGGRPLLDWEKYNEKIYRTKVKWDFNTLYENKQRSCKARYPNDSYNQVKGLADKDPQKNFHFKTGDLPKLDNIENLEIFIWPGGAEGDWNWHSFIKKVKDINYKKKLLSIKSLNSYILGSGSRYFIQGQIDLLDSPGEFYLDNKQRYLYYWPKKLPIDEQEIVAPAMSNVICFKGTNSQKKVESICLEGLTLINSDRGQAMIEMENIRNISIKKCKLFNSGGHGINISGWSQEIEIYSNLIKHIGNDGVHVDPAVEYTSENNPEDDLTSRYISKNNQIVNNYIHHTGEIIGHGSGIQLRNSGDSIISHNKIHNTPRYSISLKGPRPGTIIGKEVNGIKINRENAKEFAHSRNNIIELNDLSLANTDSQDSGVIEAWGPGTGNVINNNRIHDSEIHFSFGFGIYLDDAADEFLVKNNIIHDLQKYGQGRLRYPIFSKGINNKFYNNIVVNNNAEANFGSMEMAGEPNRDLILKRNIFCNSGDNIYEFISWTDDRYQEADFNLFYNEEGNYSISGCPYADNLEEWKKIFDNKFDQNSIKAKPLFSNIERGNYRLNADSPVYKLGFSDINIDEIGLWDDYPFAEK